MNTECATIIKYKHLFKYQNKQLVDKVMGICEYVITNNVNPTDKQQYWISKAYEYIKDIVDNDNKIENLPDMDRLWAKNSTESWDEESGPYRSMSYQSFCKVYKELQQRIKDLESKLNKEESNV